MESSDAQPPGPSQLATPSADGGASAGLDAAPASDGPAPACTNRAPTAIVDLSQGGASCQLDRAATSDGLSAGLDYFAGTVYGRIDNTNVTGCLAADFGAAGTRDPITIRAAATANACGEPCVDEFCGTSWELLVFRSGAASADPATFTFVGSLNLDRTLRDHTIATGAQTRWIALCRGASGFARDDLIVDAITICR